jgi:hypothetical protein
MTLVSEHLPSQESIPKWVLANVVQPFFFRNQRWEITAGGLENSQ